MNASNVETQRITITDGDEGGTISLDVEKRHDGRYAYLSDADGQGWIVVEAAPWGLYGVRCDARVMSEPAQPFITMDSEGAARLPDDPILVTGGETMACRAAKYLRSERQDDLVAMAHDGPKTWAGRLGIDEDALAKAMEKADGRTTNEAEGRIAVVEAVARLRDLMGAPPSERRIKRERPDLHAASIAVAGSYREFVARFFGCR